MFKIIINIEGMMCQMCEAHTNDAIRKSFKVKSVTSSAKDKETIIISNDDISDEAIKNALKETGYTILGITRESYEKKGLFGFKK
jgi:copper chaperone CopZ